MVLLSLCILLWMSPLVSASEVSTITAEPGATVVLPCQIPQNSPVIVVEWTKPDLGTQYVLFYRDGQSDPENQLPAFKNRVQLRDGQMQDGDVSLVLREVTSNDAGTYECHVFQTGAKRRKRAGSFDTEPVKVISLDVQSGLSHDEPGDGANTQGPAAVGLSVAALLVTAVVLAAVIVALKKRKDSRKPTSFQASVDEEFELQPL